MIMHKKCNKRKRDNKIVYSLNSLKFEIPVRLANKIDRLIKKKKMSSVRELIVTYKEYFNCNFD